MSDFPSVRPVRRQRVPRRHGAVALVLGLIGSLGALVLQPPVSAQTASTTTTTSTVPGLEVRLNPLIPAGSALATAPVGVQVLLVTVSNPTSALIANQQIVVRVPGPPAVITQVTESNSPVGVVDQRTGLWYHTIAQLTSGASVTLLVTWSTPCPGRWPLVTRVGDRRTSTSVQFTGTASPACPPDEVASPINPGYLELPWPPSTPAPTSTTSTTTPGTTTTAVIAPTATPSTIVNAPAPSSTTSTVARTTTTTLRRPTTTTIIICKTIGGRRYCGPQSSVYKPGQKKAVEIKPKTTTPKTTTPKTTTKKTTKR